ncbi:sugar transferase [bacterium]|nr:sugar transferase [candidate division CSSED10-310 bacterium]
MNRNRIRSRQQRHALFSIVLAVGDQILLSFAFLLSYYLRFYQEIGVSSGIVKPVPVAPPELYLKFVLIVDFLFLTLFVMLNLYRRDRARWMLDELQSTWRVLSFGFVIIASVTFFLRFRDLQFSRLVLLYSYILSMFLIPMFRLLILKIERWAHSHGIFVSNVLIVGMGEMAGIITRKIMTNPQLGYRIRGFCADVSEKVSPADDLVFLGSIDHFEDILIRYDIDEVLVSEASISHFKLLEIVSISERMGIFIKMVPTVYDLLIDFADVNDLDGLPLVAIREQPMYELRLWAKRLFDLIFSLLILSLTAPLCLVIVILIKRDSKGSVIFSQIRAGVGGVPFKMYKFRTMHIDAEQRLKDLIDINDLEEPVFKLDNDPRITGIGHFLRRTSLDEIPQFWNVVKGDMSVVGPRPEETQLADKYNIWQQRRLKAKPGITGMQQVMCRGTTSLADRIRYDIYYLRKHSLLLDIWIILKTIPVVLSGHGAR